MASVFKRGGKRNRNGVWYISYYERPGVRKTVRGCTDKAATESLARKLESDAMLRREGVLDEKQERLTKVSREPIEQHIDRFKQMMQGKGTTEKHLAATVSYIKNVCTECGFEHVGDLDGIKVSGHAADLKKEKVGLRAINARLVAIKSFSRWLFRNELIPTDPMMQVQKLNAATDRRHLRRAATEEEIAKLIAAAESGPVVLGLTGWERSVIYRIALGTGLRASEIGSLTPGSFDIDDTAKGTVCVEAAYSKHRRKDVLPLHDDLTRIIADFIADRPDAARLFRMPHKPAEMLKRDLKAAGIPYEDKAERALDFHALRHSFISRLARAGVSPATAQALARHSSITLTMDTYTHVLVEDQRAAIEKLPTIQSAEPNGRAVAVGA